MALTDSDLTDLLAAIEAGEMTDTIRASLEWILQQLIEAELAAFIGAGPNTPAVHRPDGSRSKGP